MRKLYVSLLVIVGLSFVLKSCSDDYDDVLHYRSTNEFIWEGLNQYYYWQKDSPDLNDARFATDEAFQSFLNNYSPESLFQHLRYEPGNIDKYSVLFSDYNVLEGVLSGTTKNNGVEYGLKYKSGSTTEIFGYVRYILPNSDASTKNIQRGDIFYAVNGTPLTVSNYIQLLANETYTLNLADYNNGNITPNGNSVSLTKTVYSENPVLIKNIHIVGTKKVGYLMYNGFYSNYENELNNAFAYFQAEGITHLVLDLRYNGGGSVNVATRLGSMITGQFNGQVFAKQLWNDKRLAYYNSVNPDALINKFTNTLSNGNSINSLNLNKLYVITTKSTASASELIINSLNPYIEVKTIGDVTTGKNVGSVTLYDSPTFGKQNVNPNHKYAMQPIVLKIANKNNGSSYSNGFVPNVPNPEDIGNLGILGDANEPLLNVALNYININGKFSNNSNAKVFEHFSDSKNVDGIEKGMYIENPPNLNRE
ncbi:S41 family peptidase [uncultured Flavobacterium sp.]|uniref:S41 family peptidase n=1 Tax=uncultured Flavobacterium sp. TaxID=165435 RepID=UPI0030C87C0E